MNEITFKVASHGEGKTIWLLDIANQYCTSSRKIFLFTNSKYELRDFCEKYFSLYNHVCPVQLFSEDDLTEDDIVLVDDLFSHDCSTEEVRTIQKNCYKMYITVEGNTFFRKLEKIRVKEADASKTEM